MQIYRIWFYSKSLPRNNLNLTLCVYVYVFVCLCMRQGSQSDPQTLWPQFATIKRTQKPLAHQRANDEDDVEVTLYSIPNLILSVKINIAMKNARARAHHDFGCDSTKRPAHTTCLCVVGNRFWGERSS